MFGGGSIALPPTLNVNNAGLTLFVNGPMFLPVEDLNLGNGSAFNAENNWILDGTLDLTIGNERQRLDAGDCIHMRFDQPVTFHNPAKRPVRYAVIIGRGGGAA